MKPTKSYWSRCNIHLSERLSDLHQTVSADARRQQRYQTSLHRSHNNTDIKIIIIFIYLFIIIIIIYLLINTIKSNKNRSHTKIEEELMIERRTKFIALRSLSLEQAPTYCHIVQKIQKFRHCSLSGSRRIYVGTGKRSLFQLMMYWIFYFQFSRRSTTLQNCIHRLFQLLGERIHVFVTEPRIFVS